MNKKKFCVITVDVEEDLDSNYKRRTFGGVRLLESSLQEVLDTWQAKATLFVTGEVIKECTTTIRALSRDNELAAHGLLHVSIVSLSPLLREKHLVTLCNYARELLNRDLEGFRGTRLIIDAETIGILDKLGFLYDSSVLPRYFPFKRYEGYRGRAPIYPYHPSEKDHRRPGSTRIWELPVTCARIINFPLYGTWMRYVGPKITKLLIPNADYVNIAIHSWDFVETKKLGFRTGKSFCKIFGEIIGFLYGKDFMFETCSSLCRSLKSEVIR